MILLLKMSLVSGFGVNPSHGARVLVLWVDLGSIGGWIRLFHDFVEGLILDPSLTETHEVSGSPLVARITKSRPIWGSRLVVSRALCSLLS